MPPDFYATAFELDPLLGTPELRVVPSEFRVFPAGPFGTEKGEFLFDDKAAKLVMDAWVRRGVDYTMDYEHQALSDPPVIALAACSRWVPQIRNGELWATECKWTDKAYAHLLNGEYRYISPAFTHEKDTGRVTDILNIALTNIPAMRGIDPLVRASRTTTEGKESGGMEYEKLYKELLSKFDAQTAQLKALQTENADLTAKLNASSAGATEAVDEQKNIAAALSLVGKSPTERTSAVTNLVALRTNVRALTGADSDASAIGVIHAWREGNTKVAQLTARLAEVEESQLAAEFETVLNEGGLEPAPREALRKVALEASGGKLSRSTITVVKASLAARGAANKTGGGPVKTPPGTGGDGVLDPLQVHIANVCGREPTQAKQ